MRKHLGALTLLVAATTMLTACQEDLAGGGACPVLCPAQQLDVVDTMLFPFAPATPGGLVPLDTTLFGYPPLGSEPRLLLARRGDSLVTAVVARFDTLPQRFRPRTTDTVTAEISVIDTATVSLDVDTSGIVAPDSITIEVYDVPLTTAEPDTAAVRAAIATGTPVGSLRLAKQGLTGSLRIPLDKAVVLARIRQGLRLRVAFVVQGNSSVQFDVLSRESSAPPVLRFVARAGSDTATVAVPVQSRAQVAGAQGLPELADYLFVLNNSTSAAVPAATLVVGGLPAGRAYLRFRVPRALLDSTTIVRATLLLTQIPNRGSVAASDSVGIVPRVVIASPLVDTLEIGKAALLLGNPNSTLYAIPAVVVAPADSGVRRFNIANVLRLWRLQDTTQVTRALVLQTAFEGFRPQEVRFFSTEATVDSLRPRLHVVYIPRSRFGLP